METCKSCRWWSFDLDDEVSPSEGACERIDVSGLASLAHYYIALGRPRDDDECSVWMMTKADFGCVQFEAKQ